MGDDFLGGLLLERVDVVIVLYFVSVKYCNHISTYSTYQKMACMFNPFPRLMFARHRPQLRRSSRIRQQSFRKIMRLRLKYNNTILSSTLNERRSEIIKVGKELYIDMASKRLVNIAIQSSQTSQEEDIAVTTQRKANNKKIVTFSKNLTTTFNEAAHNNQ